jgi:nicotinamide mononucleotide transporter
VITITALVYVFLAAKENPWCWAWGIISCSLWAYADFARYNLWVDGILQIFYVGMGAWGLYNWRYKPGNGQTLPITSLPAKGHLHIFLVGVPLTFILGYVFDKFTPTSLPYPDSLVTSFSILATWLTVKKKLENWLYWIVLDTAAFFLFLARDAVLVALVMGIYAIISIYGFLHWRKQWKQLAKEDKDGK